MAAAPALPDGFLIGHTTDRAGLTGCTVVLAPEGATGSCEVRGGGPGTRETDLLSPASGAQGVQAVLLSGGSAFGLAAADGVVGWLAEHRRGYPTPVALVPLVPGAVVYDLMLGDPHARPDVAAGRAACEAAVAAAPERGSVGAGTGATVGKLLGPDHWTKGGVGFAAALAGEATVAAVAVVNAFGDVLDERGEVLAGIWRDGGYMRATDLLRAGHVPRRPWRDSTTLVCVVTDAKLTKTEAWLVARAGSTGVARAVDPSATAVDGDVVFCLAGGQVVADPLVVSALVPGVIADAIRDGVRAATSVPGCAAARDR